MFNVVNSETLEVVATYELGAHANTTARVMSRDGKRFSVRRAVTAIDWKARESAKFADGTYKVPAWADSPFWIANEAIHAEHYAHVSVTNAELIAFTESDEKGIADRQTAVKPGVYLTRFFGDVLTPAQVSQYCNLFKTGKIDVKAEVKFAVTARDIIAAYQDKDGGVSSCMSHNVREYGSEVHPVSVYGCSDLKLAYIENKDGYVKARALVYDAKKTFTRIYPTPGSYYNSMPQDEIKLVHDEMEQALEALGYTRGKFTGAKFHAIEQGSAYVAPYLDGISNADLEGEMFVISPNGSYSFESTNGLLGCEAENEYTCEMCDEGCDDIYSVRTSFGRRYNTMSICETCNNDETFYCEGSCENYTTSDNESVEVDNRTYHVDYAAENFSFCQHSGEHTNEECSEVIIRVSTCELTEMWSQTAIAEDAFTCIVDGKLYSQDWIAEGTMVQGGDGWTGRMIHNLPMADDAAPAVYRCAETLELPLDTPLRMVHLRVDGELCPMPY